MRANRSEYRYGWELYMCQAETLFGSLFGLSIFATIRLMKLTASKTSKTIWLTAASLFVILALIGGYMMLARGNASADKAQECSKQMQDEFTLDSVLCSKASQ